MRDGRRKRLGLQEGTEGTVGDTYLDRILTDAEAAANPYTIAADTDVNFDTRDFRNISDTYNYYYGGGFDTAQDDATPPSSGDGGSGDGGTGGGTTPTTPGTNTPEQQRLIDEGIGVQLEPGSPVSSPYEGMPPTQEEINEFNQRPVNREYGEPMNIGYGEEQVDPSLAAAVGGIDTTPVSGGNLTTLPSGDVFATDDPMLQEKMDVVTEQDLVDDTGLLQKLGLPADFDIKKALIETGVNLIAGVPITLIARALGAVLPDRDPRQNALDELYDVKDGTIQSGLMKGYNPVSGGGLYTLSGGAKGEPPTYGLQDAYQKRIDTINKTLGGMTLEQYQNTDLVQRKKDLEEAMAKEKTMLDQLQYGDPEKIAAGIQTADDDSGSEMLDTTPKESTFASDYFDDYSTAVQQVFKNRREEPTNIEPGGTILEDDFEFLVDQVDTPKDDIFGFKDLDDQVVYSDYQDIGETSDSYNYPDRKQLVDSGTITPLEDDFQSSDQDIIDRGGGDDIGTGGLDPDRGQQVDRGSSGAGDNQPVSTTTGPPSTGFQPQSTYDAELEDDRDVGGGGNDGGNNNGGGKIVCTMMNESYGFGSFRNKIWMKFHKDLSPEYQKGYHKLFLPLVRIAKTNKVVKKVLEHIAVHSTIDMRQATRGKTHLLGRVYRKILLPLCYWVGKNAK